MNAGAKPTLSGERLELPNELLLLPPHSPLPQPDPSSSYSVVWIQNVRFAFKCSRYYLIVAAQELYIKSLTL